MVWKKLCKINSLGFFRLQQLDKYVNLSLFSLFKNSLILNFLPIILENVLFRLQLYSIKLKLIFTSFILFS
jgi:hypothetical protein